MNKALELHRHDIQFQIDEVEEMLYNGEITTEQATKFCNRLGDMKEKMRENIKEIAQKRAEQNGFGLLFK
jgi:polyhydroxyalkanoate synthesis regulator phasin